MTRNERFILIHISYILRILQGGFNEWYCIECHMSGCSEVPCPNIRRSAYVRENIPEFIKAIESWYE